MNKNILGVFACLLIVLLTSSRSFAITTEELADISEALENYIQDIYIEFEWGNDPPMNANDIQGTGFLITKGPTKCTWATKRPFNEFSLSTEEATFLNQYEDSWKGETKQAYNGKTGKHLQTGSRLDENKRFGTITNSNRLIRDIRLTPADFSVLHYSNRDVTDRTPLHKILRNKEMVRLDESIKKVNGFDAITVNIFQEQTKKLWGVVYFSVKHGYTPIRYEYWGNNIHGNSELEFFYNVTSLEKISDGVWFPKGGKSGCPDGERCDVFKATKISLNQRLEDEYFDFEFPPGTKVSDEILGLTYLFKPTEDEFNKWLDDEERLGLHDAKEGNVAIKKDRAGKQETDKTNISRKAKSTSSPTDNLQKAVDSQQQEKHLQANVQKPKTKTLIYSIVVIVAVLLLTILAVRKHRSRGGACS